MSLPKMWLVLSFRESAVELVREKGFTRVSPAAKMASGRRISLVAQLRPRSAAVRPSLGLTLQRADETAASLSLPPVESPERSRALTCCIIGPTNAGKSTLLNTLINARVSAVSAKIHTTRENTLGYLTDLPSRTQVEFVDAPGALGPDVPSLHRALWDAVRGAQLALVVVDAADVPSHRQVGRFLDRLARELDELEAAEGPERRPLTALVLNKVDIVNKKERLLKASAALHGEFAFDGPPFMVSAHTGDGVDHLRGWLLLQAKPRQWTMAAGVTHVQPPLTRATEIIREALFTYLDRELPYVLEQRNLGWTELTNPTQGLRIDQQLLIPRERKSVRKILEARLPGIATSARRQLRAEFGRPVFLHLSIGVASNVFELESARPHDVLQMLADRGPDARET